MVFKLNGGKRDSQMQIHLYRVFIYSSTCFSYNYSPLNAVEKMLEEKTLVYNTIKYLLSITFLIYPNVY